MTKGVAFLISWAWIRIQADEVMSRRDTLDKFNNAPLATQCGFLKRPRDGRIDQDLFILSRTRSARHRPIRKYPLKQILVFRSNLLVSVGFDHLTASSITDSGA